MAAREFDDESDDTPSGSLLPKDDRLWRHPSELAEPEPSQLDPNGEARTPRTSRWRLKRQLPH